MAVSTNDKLQLLANTTVGGNIVAIVLRQAIRLNSLRAALRFKAQQDAIAALGQGGFFPQPTAFIGAIPVNVRLQEVYTGRSDITQHAAESGAKLTDHVIVHPLTIMCSFEVTNWEAGHAEHALQLIDDLHKSRERISLATAHKVLDDMVIAEYRATNDLPDWKSIKFQVTFQQVKLVELEAVKVPAAQVQNAGQASGPPVDAASTVSAGSTAPKQSFAKANLSLFAEGLKKLGTDALQYIKDFLTP